MIEISEENYGDLMKSMYEGIDTLMSQMDEVNALGVQRHELLTASVESFGRSPFGRQSSRVHTHFLVGVLLMRLWEQGRRIEELEIQCGA